MLESARRLADLEGAPRVEIDTVASFWDKVRAESPDLPGVGRRALPRVPPRHVHDQRPDQAREPAQRAGAARGRAVVGRGRDAVGVVDAYPADALDEAWKLLLLNQFHDIIPGSSIHWANEDCLRDHARIAAVTSESDRRGAAGDRRAGRHRRGMTRPFVVFNAASRDRREVVEVASGRRARARAGRRCPRCGYADDRLSTRRAQPSRRPRSAVSDRSLENELLRVDVGRRRLAHVDLRQGARPRGARARNARQSVPAARGQPARVRRVERRHRLSRPRASTSPTSRRSPWSSAVRCAARCGSCASSAIRRSRRPCGSRADPGGSSSTPRSTGTSATSS